MDKKIKVGILSDSCFIPTGYSNNAKLLAKYLSSRGFEIHYLANGYQGADLVNAVLTDGTTFNYKIYGMGKMNYFQDNMSKILKDNKIDFFIILLDTFMLWGNDGWFLKIDTTPAITSFWYPSDGGATLPRNCDLILKKVDFPVAMSLFGKKQAKDLHNLETKYIPLGTEKNRFFRLTDQERENIRAKWGLTGKFVIGTVMRNQGRKMPDKFIKTIKVLCDNLKKKSIDNWVVLMHTDFDDQAAVVDLRMLIRRYNLENHIIPTGMSALKGFEWNQMNEIYNLFDVFFLSTSGEGFGIPIIESMACKVPCVVPGYTTGDELVRLTNSGFATKLVGCEDINFFNYHAKEYDDMVLNGTITGGWDVERGLIDLKDSADKIYEIYKNPELAKQMGENGRKAVEDNYEFDEFVGKAWENLILEAVSKR